LIKDANEDVPIAPLQKGNMPIRNSGFSDPVEQLNLRHTSYEWVKNELEEKQEADLDHLTERIEQSLGSKANPESIRGSVSSTLSALRNGFPELIENAWNESIWRGKSTGRNPHIKVKPSFSMPDYASLWNRYSDYLEKRKRRR